MLAKINETIASVSLEGALRRLHLDPPDFFTDGAAATASLELLLIKVLRLIRPARILEFGSGQTTKLLALYYHQNPDTYVLTLEEDLSWHHIIEPQITIAGRHHDYRHSPVAETTVLRPGSSERVSTFWYADEMAIQTSQFNLILVDGPATEGPYSRAGILRHVPNALADSFVLIFDDAERYGERMTIMLAERALREAGRNYVRFDIYGQKAQTVFCSRDYAFLRSV